MRYKIGVITCYFGKFPWYFHYFLHSCSFNPTIDFIIITDSDDDINNLPKNVFIHKKTLAEVCKIATKKLGFEVAIPYPYKLCDFKPAYGFLFPEIIKGYDFWGHADIDVVYGDIRNFITDDLLNTYDVVSTRHDYITGTFCLFRNIRRINNLFMQSKDYQKVFSSEDHFCFDECNFLWRELEAGMSIYELPCNIESMTHVVKKMHDKKQLKAFFDFIIVEGTPGNVTWDKGKIIYKDQYEALFYHLIRFKTQCRRPKILNPIPEAFSFTRKKIVVNKKSEIPSL